MASTEEVSKHYLDDAGERYVQHYQADPFMPGYPYEVAYFTPYLNPTDRVLDFGCGNGGMLRLIAEHVHCAEGLEVNDQAASIARSFNLRVYPGLDELPAEPVYDAVLSNHVLEHIRDVPSTLERLRKSMKPGALLLLKLPLDDWRERRQKTWSRDDIDHHLQTWTPLLIGNVLMETGYEVSDIRIITSAWHPRLFPLAKVGLDRLAFWLLSIYKKRRQLFVVARVPF